MYAKGLLLIITVLALQTAIEHSGSTDAAAIPWLTKGMIKSWHTMNKQQCMMCRFSVNIAHYAMLSGRGADQVYKISNNFCTLAKIQSPQVCSQVTKLYNPTITKILSAGLMTPDQICGYLSRNTCGKFYNPLSDWEVNLNVSVSLDQDQIAKMHELAQLERQPQSKYRIAHISDTHVDLEYETGAISVCAEPLCCRAKSTPNNISASSPKAGYWGSYSDCDVPLRTLDSALKALNIVTDGGKSVDFVIWTGDIQPHDVWEQSKAEARAVYSAVFQKFNELLPNAMILPTFGNHEMVPVDQFSPSSMFALAKDDSPEWLYQEFDAYWSRWLPRSTQATIMRDGFYSAVIRPGLKVVSLNTNFCHNKNFWLYINTTDPGNQLQWLIHELQISELEHEQVHIIGHIPPGSDDCLRVWSKNYNRVVRRFRRTIGGQFFGHTHVNEFEVFYDHDDELDTKPQKRQILRKDKPESGTSAAPQLEPVSVAFVGPSVTTFIGLNPSFRLYDVDPNRKHMPVDFETYFMNLTEANINGASRQPEWKSAGTFSKLFGIPDTSPQSMHNLLVSIADDMHAEEIANMHYEMNNAIDQHYEVEFVQKTPEPALNISDNLFKLYDLSNGYSDAAGRAGFEKMHIEKKKEFLCHYFTAQAHDMFACQQFMKSSVPVGYLRL